MSGDDNSAGTGYLGRLDPPTTATLGQSPQDVNKSDPDDTPLWSVTTLIGALDKPAIPYWAAEETAKAALESVQTWQAMLADQGYDETVKWLRDARFRKPKTLLAATDLGTTVHNVCEHYALYGTKPDTAYIEKQITDAGGTNIDTEHEIKTVQAMLDQFDTWLQHFTPRYDAAELTVYNPTYGYAGTLDALLTIDTTRFITDYKTSREPYDGRGKPKTPYPEQVGLQLAAYRYAEFAAGPQWRPRRVEQFRRRYYLLGPTERRLAQRIPEVDHGLVIHITPDACEAFPIDCHAEYDEDTGQPSGGPFYSFLSTIEAFRWLNETSKTVMGKPLQ